MVGSYLDDDTDDRINEDEQKDAEMLLNEERHCTVLAAPMGRGAPEECGAIVDDNMCREGHKQPETVE